MPAIDSMLLTEIVSDGIIGGLYGAMRAVRVRICSSCEPDTLKREEVRGGALLGLPVLGMVEIEMWL